MPYASLLPAEDVSEYLDGVLNTVLVKDVATRHPRISMPVLRALLAFLADNVGNRFSLKTVADTLTANGSKVLPTTVSEYLNALMECYLIFKADPYDAKGRRLLQQGASTTSATLASDTCCSDATAATSGIAWKTSCI